MQKVFVSTHANSIGSDGAIKPRVDFANSLPNAIKINFPYNEYVESVNSIIDQLSNEDVLFIQYPLYNTGINVIKEIRNKLPNISMIGIIHDIDTKRFHGDTLTKDSQEIKDFNLMNAIYVSSSNLIKEIRDAGYNKQILIHGLWSNKFNPTKQNVLYAGNLNKEKAGFLLNGSYNISSLAIYGNVGNDIQEIKLLNNYMGVGSNDYLIGIGNQFNYGLVWDEGVDGQTTWSDYNSINMPAKLSMYLRSGLPVIVKSGTRASEIVKKYEIGVVINSLIELDDVLKIDQNTGKWWDMKKNIINIQQDIQSGMSFFKEN